MQMRGQTNVDHIDVGRGKHVFISFEDRYAVERDLLTGGPKFPLMDRQSPERLAASLEQNATILALLLRW